MRALKNDLTASLLILAFLISGCGPGIIMGVPAEAGLGMIAKAALVATLETAVLSAGLAEIDKSIDESDASEKVAADADTVAIASQEAFSSLAIEVKGTKAKREGGAFGIVGETKDLKVKVMLVEVTHQVTKFGVWSYAGRYSRDEQFSSLVSSEIVKQIEKVRDKPPEELSKLKTQLTKLRMEGETEAVKQEIMKRAYEKGWTDCEVETVFEVCKGLLTDRDAKIENTEFEKGYYFKILATAGKRDVKVFGAQSPTEGPKKKVYKCVMGLWAVKGFLKFPDISWHNAFMEDWAKVMREQSGGN